MPEKICLFKKKLKILEETLSDAMYECFQDLLPYEMPREILEMIYKYTQFCPNPGISDFFISFSSHNANNCSEEALLKEKIFDILKQLDSVLDNLKRVTKLSLQKTIDKKIDNFEVKMRIFFNNLSLLKDLSSMGNCLVMAQGVSWMVIRL